MSRPRYLPDGRLCSRDLEDEANWRAGQWGRHQLHAHPEGSVTGAGLAHASRRIRFAFERLLDGTREALVAIDGVIRVRVGAGSTRAPANTVAGVLEADSLALQGLELGAPQPSTVAPASAFCLRRRPADPTEGEPEALVLTLAAPADKGPAPGLLVARTTTSGGIGTQLQILPGQGVRIGGRLMHTGRLIERSPAPPGGEPPSGEELRKAFLRSPEGAVEREAFQNEALAGLRLEIVEPSRTSEAAGERWRLGWRLTNETSFAVNTIRLYAAVVPNSAAVARVWQELPSPPRVVLRAEGDAIEAPFRAEIHTTPSGDAAELRLLAAGLGPYDVAVTAAQATWKPVP